MKRVRNSEVCEGMNAGNGTWSITATSALLLSPVETMQFLYSACSGLTMCLLLHNSQLTNTHTHVPLLKRRM